MNSINECNKQGDDESPRLLDLCPSAVPEKQCPVSPTVASSQTFPFLLVGTDDLNAQSHSTGGTHSGGNAESHTTAVGGSCELPQTYPFLLVGTDDSNAQSHTTAVGGPCELPQTYPFLLVGTDDLNAQSHPTAVEGPCEVKFETGHAQDLFENIVTSLNNPVPPLVDLCESPAPANLLTVSSTDDLPQKLELHAVDTKNLNAPCHTTAGGRSNEVKFETGRGKVFADENLCSASEKATNSSFSIYNEVQAVSSTISDESKFKDDQCNVSQFISQPGTHEPIEIMSSNSGAEMVGAHLFQRDSNIPDSEYPANLPHHPQIPTNYGHVLLPASYQNSILDSIAQPSSDGSDSKPEASNKRKASMEQTVTFPHSITDESRTLLPSEHGCGQEPQVMTLGSESSFFSSGREPSRSTTSVVEETFFPSRSKHIRFEGNAACGIVKTTSMHTLTEPNQCSSCPAFSNESENTSVLVSKMMPAPLINNYASGNNCREITFEIPVNFFTLLKNEFSLGYINLAAAAAGELGSVRNFFINEVNYRYGRRYENSYPKFYFLDAPTEYLANFLLSSVDTKQDAVPASSHASCEVCKHATSEELAKISADLTRVPVIIQHPPIRTEHDVLILFQFSKRCYPFCTEALDSRAGVRFRIDNKTYEWSEKQTRDPLSVNCGDDTLMIVVYFDGIVNVFNHPNFQWYDHITLHVSIHKCVIHLEDKDLESHWPVTDFIDCNEHKLYFKWADEFTFKFSHFQLAGRLYNEVVASKFYTQRAFMQQTWKCADAVFAHMSVVTAGNRFEYEHRPLYLGKRGCLTHKLSHKDGYCHRLFRPFLTEDNKLIVLEKSLKCSLNFISSNR